SSSSIRSTRRMAITPPGPASGAFSALLFFAGMAVPRSGGGALGPERRRVNRAVPGDRARRLQRGDLGAGVGPGREAAPSRLCRRAPSPRSEAALDADGPGARQAGLARDLAGAAAALIEQGQQVVLVE